MKIGICAIFKDEADYILEWIAFHHLIGVDRFFLYDHESTDGGAELVAASPFRDIATIVRWTPRPGQLQAYEHFFTTQSSTLDWAAVIDVDEFIVPDEGSTLHQIVQRLDDCGAILLNWVVFGPSGHIERPRGLVIESYSQRLPLDFEVNRHVKSIVNTNRYRAIGPNPHVFDVDGRVRNALGDEVPNLAIQESATHSGCVINHYYTKSESDWLAKLRRGKADTEDRPDLQYKVDVFQHVRENAIVPDRRIRSQLRRLKAVLSFCEP